MDTSHTMPVAGISRRHRWSKRILKGVFSIIIVGLVLKYQVNRPRNPLWYHTSNPNDNRRDGMNYTCGCNLPAILQARIQVAPNPTEQSNITFKSEHIVNSTWKNINVCQDASTIKDVNVLMYPNLIQEGDPNFTQLGILDSTLQDAYGPEFHHTREKRNVTGHSGVKRVNDISWHNNRFLDPLSELYLSRVPKQRQLKVPINYLLNSPDSEGTQTPFLDFPTLYINLAFAYNCTDCSACPLENVNQIFRNISGDFNSTWGSCDYWWNKGGAPCKGEHNWYTAKCVLYPTEALPLNYAVQDFFTELTQMLQGQENIFTPEDLADKNGTEGLMRNQTAMTSFSANVLHMEFSKMESESIELNFFELQKYSAAWLAILDAFPTLGSECFKLPHVPIVNGTAICNVFTNAKDKTVDRKCIQMSNKTTCEDLYIRKNDRSVNVSVDADDKTLWSEFGVTPKDWVDLMCMNYSTLNVSPYLVLWRTASVMQNNSLNRFLESKKWSIDWARDSGVCINPYVNVSPQTFMDGDKNTTAYMETTCHDAGYCWLTGRYHRLTDTPGQEWHEITPPIENPPDLFVCYVFEDQNVWIWLLFIGRVLFGWLGTADLICEWIIIPVSRFIGQNINKVPNGLARNRATDLCTTPRKNAEVHGGLVVMRHLYRASWSDTAVILGRRKPIVELEMCAPLAGAVGVLGKTTKDPDSKEPSTKTS